MKRVAFTTFGCRLNQYDTETIRTLLEHDGGFETVAVREEADVFVVNTCSVTAQADASARKAIRRIHAEHPDAPIVVAGCYAQRAPDDLAALPGVALVVGAADRGHIAQMMQALDSADPRVAVSPISAAKSFLDVPITEMMEHSRAYVKVQEGCNESCSFCIVPQTRGASRSRIAESVVSQVEALVASGYVEIVLTGVHLGDYGLDLEGNRKLCSLIRRILTVDGLERFRLSSIEPASISDELLELISGEPRIARHLHIPFQSGSDAVLERMRRRYRAADFVRLVERAAKLIPECGIGCDVICGFPGETDADFQRTFDCIESLPITYLHPFTYSSRPGSESEHFAGQLSGDIKKRRTRALKRLGQAKNLAFRRRHLGRQVDVLVESGRRGGEPRLWGWTDNYLKVDLGVGEAPATVETVRIFGLSDSGLLGEPPLDGAKTSAVIPIAVGKQQATR